MSDSVTVTALPAFVDNYIWLIEKPDCRRAIVVDPGDPKPVIEALEQRGLDLHALLITHHHADHIGGIHALAHRYPGLEVYGPDNEKIPNRTHAVFEGDRIYFDFLDLAFGVVEVPGHTHGHIAFHEKRRQWLFSGDTLFVTGCGGVFTGTHAHLYASLMRIARLPPTTKVYCAHEYTLDNIGFAKWVEPENPDLLLFESQSRKRRQQGLATVPTTVGQELLCNPFLRLGQKSVLAGALAWRENPQCDLSDMDITRPEHVFHLIRNWKDVAYD